MSKILKFIVHFIVICTIVCVLGLALPPFFCVTTVIMDDAEKATNLPLGSVTYAIPEKASEIAVGTPILVQEDSKTYRYNVASLDLTNGTGTVIDPSVSGGAPITVAVKEYVPKVVATIGFVGYLLIATKSIEGLIILGLAILFLIILYVIAELWKKEPEETELRDTPARYIKSAKELKKEEKIKARLLKEEEREIKRQSKKSKRTIRTGGFVDEIEDEDLETEAEEKPAVMQNAAASEAHEVLKKEIAAATAEEQQPVPETVTGETRQIVEEKERKPKETVKEAELPKETEDSKPVVYKKLAMPVMTAAQLAQKAKEEGDAPEIEQDDITKVTRKKNRKKHDRGLLRQLLLHIGNGKIRGRFVRVVQTLGNENEKRLYKKKNNIFQKTLALK